MIAEFGHIALIAAFMVAVAQSILPMVGAHRGDVRLMAFGDRASIIQMLLTVLSYAMLTVVFLSSDFSVKLAVEHSHSAKPLLYKISGVWANHEGSMLLWILILAIYGAMIPIFGRRLPSPLKARAIAVQGMLAVGFVGFTLLTSNPFERLNPVPIDGKGMNPLLQDPGLAFHPPFLYLGYVGFSVAFSFAIAALIEGRVDAVWAKWLRPWVLIAWSFLTVGIALGSYWAYYELGWGGWWMWDPVENVSFMPWLAATALLHSILVLGTRHSMASWTILLAIATFSLSLIGTFVVRSGVLVSVHAFATDPERGVYLLALMAIATGGALALYALRANSLRVSDTFKAVSRDGALVTNNILLVTATATVFLGTFYPLFMDATTGEKISVGAPYFNLTFGPLMVILMVFMGVGPMLKWREDSLGRLKTFGIISAVLIAVITVLTVIFGKSVLGGLSLGICAYLAFGTIMVLVKRARIGQVSWADSKRLLRAQPAATYAFVGAHLGVAMFAVGVTTMYVWQQDDAKALKVGESMDLAGYTFTLKDMGSGQRENYQYFGGNVDITKDDQLIKTVYSERRFFPVRDMITTEAGMHLSPGNSLFASIGEGTEQSGWVVRAYLHPYVIWIWWGCVLMALSGFVALADRRLRDPKDITRRGALPSDTTSAVPAE
ncbi:heme lyase CcmF/NrfE family subunit [Fretibacter rubidus]|uniref:heme lyase CcmF/NrfE family subunit n=1 Tax=Fretibacter rubidus TaxID=570162 RepID=UPI00352AC20F